MRKTHQPAIIKHLRADRRRIQRGLFQTHAQAVAHVDGRRTRGGCLHRSKERGGVHGYGLLQILLYALDHFGTK
ncbi:hypothetical protein D9M69_726510 [compost metagenome]